MAADLHTDVIIVGAGLVGLTATIALARLGRQVVLIDAYPQSAPTFDLADIDAPWDQRIYALTNQTVQWLSEIGVWAQMPPSRVTRLAGMHLWAPSQHHADPSLRLEANQANLAHLGYIVESQTLAAACWQVLAQLNVTVLQGALPVALMQKQAGVSLQLAEQSITAQLLLGADGANSWVRAQCGLNVQSFDFAQTALVTNFVASHAHHHIARQWFGSHETLALLPLAEQALSLVWALPQHEAQQLASVSAAQLADKVSQRIGHVCGTLQPLGEISTYALKQHSVSAQVVPGVMLLGDAAHQIHPMAGQGVNLGFEDVMTLCTQLQQSPARRPLGDIGFLKHIARARKINRFKMHTLTRGLDALFARPEAAWTHLAVLGMHAIAHNTALQRLLIHTASGK